MSQDEPNDAGGPSDLALRLQVLEMTVAAMAARLPKNDLEEVVSLLVFIARGADAAAEMEGSPSEPPTLRAAGQYATLLLERIAHSRASDRAPASSGAGDA